MADIRKNVVSLLDKEKFRYQKAISDLSGNDITYHGEDPEKMVRQVRNWIYHIKKEKLPSGKSIWTTYNEFANNFEKITHQEGYSKEDIATMPWSEYMGYIRQWISNRKR